MADAVVLLTHFWSPRLAQHWQRLKTQAGTVHPVFLAYHQMGDKVPEGMPADIVVRNADCAAVVPYRYKDSIGRGALNASGYVDMVWITMMRQPLLAQFDRIWLVEYDVDFSGDWADFFTQAATYEADLLTCQVRFHRHQPHWAIWRTLRHPRRPEIERMAAFMPISRYSKALVSCYAEVLSHRGWQGHLEPLLPTLAHAKGFSVVDLGGDGPLVPPALRGRHYTGDCDVPDGLQYTHRFTPTHADQYYVAAPERFTLPNMIYHPVKTEPPASPGSQPPLRWSIRLRMFLRPKTRLRNAYRWLSAKR